MIQVHSLTCNMLQENCYIIHDESKECVIIDCGAFYEQERSAIQQYISKNQLQPVQLIGTHGHIDHHFGNAFLHKEYGLLPTVHQADKFLMEQQNEQAEYFAGAHLTEQMPMPKTYFSEDDKISFGSHTFTILETPGHSPGSVFFYCAEENIAFSGDTLFHYSIGRTDLEGGSMFQMIQSLRMISQLPDMTKIYPGHGVPTTIGTEIAGNPYMDR